MEHRRNVRGGIKGHATLSHPMHGWAVGQIHDLSLSGALIHLARGSFPVLTPVSLVLHFRTQNGSEQLGLSAIIARADGASVRLAFPELDAATEQRLQQIIDAARSAQRALRHGADASYCLRKA